MNNKAIVVGAGIVGLATARALSLKGFHVTVIEKTTKAVGASIRNFGMVWPIGQPEGTLLNRALRSKNIWQEIAHSTGLWYEPGGSIHVAYQQDEWDVLAELYEAFKLQGRSVELISSQQTLDSFKGINSHQLLGGLYSKDEIIVNPMRAIPAVAAYLEEFLDVEFKWGTAVTAVQSGKVYCGDKQFDADLVFICNGADFEWLYPDSFATQEITRCKLQMTRYAPIRERINTAVCGALSLTHYASFKIATSLPILQKRIAETMPEYLQHGIHVMVSQNDLGEVTVGDSHEYGLLVEPFNKEEINQLILSYLGNFMQIGNWQLKESWHGVYAKMTNQQTELIMQPETDVWVINGVGGAGMTLSFGLAEEVIDRL